MRFWFWTLGAAIAVLVAVIVYTIVSFASLEGGRLFSIQFLVNGAFVYPGLVLSLAVDLLILSRRTPHTITRLERGALVGLLALALVVLAVSFIEHSLLLSTIYWLLLVTAAVWTTSVLGMTNSRLAAERAAETGRENGSLDDLLAGGED